MPRKKQEHCDFHGTCKNKAYREVYPMLMKGKEKRSGWNYLCRRHFTEEERRLKWKLPSCSIDP